MSKEHIEALTIAGHDSDGSAGMPADLHAFYARGVYGMCSFDILCCTS